MLICLVAAATAASPGLVTTARGDVTLNGEPVSVPLVLAEGQTLDLGAGAEVVVLYQGAASQHQGPSTLTVSELQGASASTGEQVATLDSVLSRETSTARTGATRAAAELQLLRPVVGDEVFALQSIQWRCAETAQGQPCPEIPVEVYSFMDDAVLWTAAGAGSVDYAGPELPPGPYTVRLSGVDFAFKVASAGEKEQVQSAVQTASQAGSALSQVDQLSLVVGLYAQSGHLSEALWALESGMKAQQAPELDALQATLETQAGQR
ncbi:MAG: hypothetical protein VX899_23710 [Myxococcota bacterium]|nr:hypothetical protein [Myxococcota bacterium]